MNLTFFSNSINYHLSFSPICSIFNKINHIISKKVIIIRKVIIIIKKYDTIKIIKHYKRVITTKYLKTNFIIVKFNII